MIGSTSVEVERKVIAILRVLDKSPDSAMGARVIARQLKTVHGVELSERAVRYHLKLMDERGLTQAVGRDGRIITPAGVDELHNALVADKVGIVINRIELLAFRTTFDWETRTGLLPINISLFSRRQFPGALKAMRAAFKAGICVSDLVAIAEEGQSLGDRIIPAGKVGLGTVCSIVINGALLKACIPTDSRFGGILQIRDHRPLRFVELISYSGTSLDPSEIFIRGDRLVVIEVFLHCQCQGFECSLRDCLPIEIASTPESVSWRTVEGRCLAPVSGHIVIIVPGTASYQSSLGGLIPTPFPCIPGHIIRPKR